MALVLGLAANGWGISPAAPAELPVSAFGLALVGALWAFDGWADLSYAAGEVKDPQRNLPRALLIGTGAVLAIYLAANVAYLAVLPIDQIRTSKLVAADVAQNVMGAGGVAFVSITVMISTFGTLNNSLLTAPRIIFAAADDHLFPRWIAAVHPRFKTPWVSILLCIALGVVFLLLRKFEQLTDLFVIAFLPFYGLGVAAIFKLRGPPDYHPTFKVPLYPIVPLIFLGSVVALLANRAEDKTARLDGVDVRDHPPRDSTAPYSYVSESRCREVARVAALARDRLARVVVQPAQRLSLSVAARASRDVCSGSCSSVMRSGSCPLVNAQWFVPLSRIYLA